MSSTTTSTDGSETRPAASVVSRSTGTWDARSRVRSLTPMPASTIQHRSGRPGRRSGPGGSDQAEPTFPHPSTAMRTTRSEGVAKVTRSRYRLTGGEAVIRRRGG